MAKRILLADDSITIQKVVELTFSDGDYVVTAVNNGAKAILKLAEMRPDIILSDIIMPEKNGYEVCEYVKSHPEFRTIPVILLTGTFEPFDPDRADKAGCDAVVTKPFESQSLIQKVDELIEHSRAMAPTAPQQAIPDPPQPFSTGVFTPQASAPFQDHGSDIFGAAEPPATPEAETPFAAGAPEYSGETRAFPRMSFEEMQRMANEPAAPPPPPPPPTPEPSPWDEPPAATGETRAFPSMGFDYMRRMADQATAAPTPPPPPPPPPPTSTPEPSPWDEAPPPAGETRAFPSMSFDDMRRMADESPAAAPAPPAPAPPSWDTQPPVGGSSMTSEAPRTPEPSPWDEPAAPAASSPAAASPWDEQPEPEYGETRALPRMSFDDLEKMAAATPPPQQEPSARAPAPEAAPQPPASQQAPEGASSAPGGEFTDEQIDRIARRVVQLMSDQVVRTIAWEVIPDLAEMLVKERIRQLESEG